MRQALLLLLGVPCVAPFSSLFRVRHIRVKLANGLLNGGDSLSNHFLPEKAFILVNFNCINTST